MLLEHQKSLFMTVARGYNASSAESGSNTDLMSQWRVKWVMMPVCLMMLCSTLTMHQSWETGHSCCGNLTAFSPFSLFISLTCLMSWSSASGLNPGGRCVNARVCYEEIDLFSYCLFEPNYLHSNWP